MAKVLIKYNNGNPIALCNRCFCIMCYVSCSDIEGGKDCVVIERNGLDKDYITTPIGKTPPPYCDECNYVLFNISLNE